MSQKIIITARRSLLQAKEANAGTAQGKRRRFAVMSFPKLLSFVAEVAQVERRQEAR